MSPGGLAEVSRSSPGGLPLWEGMARTATATRPARDHLYTLEPTMDRYPGYYWILTSDEPEPAYWDGTGWALIGGGEVEDPKVLSEEQLLFHDAPVE